ncbi:MAG: NAD(P)H-dependent oxidoreductase [Gammaproteobacteria bacterium]|nr:NAD(P)H-dependent oxidoreductase [Gammaproteobacteria bacterium]
MKLLTFAATNSTNSINKQLATYAASLVDNAQVDVIDLNDFEMPIFSEQREKTMGQPEQAKTFFNKISEADAIILSFAEYNGSYTAAYKNIFDWASRIDQKVFQNKPMVMLATSPGPGGAASVLSSAVASAPYFAGDVRASLSVPSFYDNYDAEQKQITNESVLSELKSAVSTLAA